MMQTRITKLFKIQHPILLPGMSWISQPKLVAAVSNAGGLGILASGPLSAIETAAAIKEIRRLTDNPFGIGTTLMMPGAKENATVALEEEVPVINYSLGKGDWLAERAHIYGGKVIATVTSLKHAKSARASGADALLVTGHEAAAHGGDVTSLVLVPVIASNMPDLPLVAAGGFGDGRGLLAALSLGADAVAMGTRFACTKESPLHENVKAAISSPEKTENDTVYSKNIDGISARVLKTPFAAQTAVSRPNPLRVLIEALKQAKQFGVNPVKILPGYFWEPDKIYMLAQFGGATRKFELATRVEETVPSDLYILLCLSLIDHEDSVVLSKVSADDGKDDENPFFSHLLHSCVLQVQGDLEKGIQFVGQIQGLVNDVPTVHELVKRVLSEAARLHERQQMNFFRERK